MREPIKPSSSLRCRATLAIRVAAARSSGTSSATWLSIRTTAREVRSSLRAVEPAWIDHREASVARAACPRRYPVKEHVEVGLVAVPLDVGQCLHHDVRSASAKSPVLCAATEIVRAARASNPTRSGRPSEAANTSCARGTDGCVSPRTPNIRERFIVRRNIASSSPRRCGSKHGLPPTIDRSRRAAPRRRARWIDAAIVSRITASSGKSSAKSWP